MKTRILNLFFAVAAWCALGASTTWATTIGSLSNFDVVNDTEVETEGFEIELEDVHSSDVYGTFGAPYNRYGDPILEDTATGLILRWMAKWDPVSMTYDTATPAAPGNISPSGHDCYNGGPIGNYLSSGCEHFGVSLGRAQTATTYRWLIADANNPGQLIGGNNVPIPAPTFNVVAEPAPGNPPVVQAVFEAPREDSDNRKFGDAYWVKMIKTKVHVDRQMELDDLLLGRQDDPDDSGLFEVEDEDDEIEIEWSVVQNRLDRPEENELAEEIRGDANDKSVAYRFEFYEYTGLYDPEEHEAICGGDGGCDEPLPGELGGYIGAQMAGINFDLGGGLVGDFDSNGLLNAADIDDLTGQSAGATNPAEYDLNNDALVNEADINTWVKDVFGSWVGDADLNGEFNSSDLIVVLASGTYESDVASVWSTGDFNGDGRTNSSDLVAALADGGYEVGPRAAVMAVPEPACNLLMGIFAAIALMKSRRSRK
jgi:hypothetical protein